MKERAVFIVILSFLLITTESVAQKGIRFKKYTWYQGLNLATQQNKFLMVYISQPGCEYCKEFNSVTLKNPELTDFLNRFFITVKHSVKTKYGEALARDYHLQSTPALMIQKPGSESLPLIVYNTLNADELLKVLRKFTEN